MRRVVLQILLLIALRVCAWAQEIRVTTWNLEWFPSGSPNSAPWDVENKRINDAASALRAINPDVILLQEVRDLATCEKLTSALMPEKYSVLVCSQFRDEFGGGLGRQQVAILGKQLAFAAWSERWKSLGSVDPPRGFAFAAIRYGTNDIGFYSLHLKSNLTRTDRQREHQLNILKRELAAEQTIQHARDIDKLLTNKLGVLVIAGDFNTNPDEDLFVSEKTLRSFEQENFLSGFEGVPLVDRVTHPNKGGYPDTTFDYVFVRGRSAETPQIFTSSVSDHYPVTRTVKLGASTE